MTRRITFSSSLLIAILVLGAQFALGADSKSDPSKSKVGDEDAQFAREAASGGMMEVQLGKIAQERASSSQVKEFGSRMVKDHSKANDELKKIAAKKNIKLPTELEAKHKATVNKLSKLKGDEFDREYMTAMVDDHKEDGEKFQEQADKGKDPELKELIEHTKSAFNKLPEIQTFEQT